MPSNNIQNRRLPQVMVTIAVVLTFFLLSGCTMPEVLRFKGQDLSDIKSAGVIDLTDNPTFPTAVEPSSYYYRQITDPNQRMVYNALVQSVKNFDDNVTFKISKDQLSSLDGNSLQQIYTLVYRDHPEFFWMPVLKGDGIMIRTLLDKNGGYLNIRTPWRMPKAKAVEAQQKLNRWVDEVAGKAQDMKTNYEKAKLAYHAVVKYLSYDEKTINDQSLYTGLMTGKAVCAGYVKLYQVLLNKLNVPNAWIPVIAKHETGQITNNHVVTAIQMAAEEWYWSDPTWGDAFATSKPELGLDWSSFSFDQAEFDNRYSPEKNLQDTMIKGCCKAPVNNSDKYSYFKHEHLWVQSLDRQHVQAVIERGVQLSEGGFFMIGMPRNLIKEFTKDFENGRLRLMNPRTGRYITHIFTDKNLSGIMVQAN